MFKNFIVSEFKKWIRDSIMKFLLFYPIILGLIGRYALPIIAENSGFSIERYADLILVILTLFTPHIYGALIGFSILDDRDDNILSSIKVTPLGINQFLSFRIAMAFVLCFLGTVFVMWFSDVGDISMINIISLAFLASLAAPMTGLLINSISSNKIEGFAVVKGSGTILAFPIIALFFIDKKEFFFSFAPGFWPAKAISSLIRGEELLQLSYSQYYLIGLVYVIILNILVYNIFVRKTQQD
ncbi:ABC transporter permease [Clostridium sp. D2Q-11]|uniref:ABC transporter permease n=1 Tax=Anaeromonas frigoriresistens TaxID=2683708 RepID=A0A942UV77_9FIRM|nr:ABC transporter permease [Anaeromonas frigoriresistens]MBS4538635.1 ABC transporter permease [Anaeromonas frigoriresistens]